MDAPNTAAPTTDHGSWRFSATVISTGSSATLASRPLPWLTALAISSPRVCRRFSRAPFTGSFTLPPRPRGARPLHDE